MRVSSAADLNWKASNATSDDDISVLLGMIATEFGFEHYSFWAGSRSLDEQGPAPVFANWPQEHNPFKTDRQLWSQSTIVRQTASTEQATPIAEINLEDIKSSPMYGLLVEARQRKRSLGLCLPIWYNQRFVGLATFIGRDGDLSVEGTTMLHMLVSTMHRNKMHRGDNHSTIKLTNREREVLRWTAAGKTAGEIGTILSLSARTVEFHLQSAAERVGTVNRTHTVAEALRRGLM